jgi:uncharacterized pyridoxamine 5'-phosphate oxidase family protein
MTHTIKTMSSPESPEMIRSFLDSHTEGVLTTLDEHGSPHASVIDVHVNARFETVFIIKTDSVKYKNILTNDKVVFVCFDQFSRDEVQIEGNAFEITDRQMIDTEKQRIEAGITANERKIPPYTNILSDDFAVCVIQPSLVHSVIYMRTDADVEAFHETIEFET